MGQQPPGAPGAFTVSSDTGVMTQLFQGPSFNPFAGAAPPQKSDQPDLMGLFDASAGGQAVASDASTNPFASLYQQPAQAPMMQPQQAYYPQGRMLTLKLTILRIVDNLC